MPESSQAEVTQKGFFVMSKSLPITAIELINGLEIQIIEAEESASDLRWEQSRHVYELNEEGYTQEEIAASWIKDPKTQESYSQTHVSFTIRCYELYYLSNNRPPWNTAYNSKEIRNPNGSRPHVSHNSGENEWYTPAEYIEAAYAVMDGIDLDPASSDKADEVIGANVYYTIEDDGLSRDWAGRVWMNPPYARDLIEKFTSKLIYHFCEGEISEAVVLVNNATETKWFQDMFEVVAAVCFPYRRVKYWGPDGQTGAPLQGQAFLYFGDNVDRFTAEFSQFGKVLYG